MTAPTIFPTISPASAPAIPPVSGVRFRRAGNALLNPQKTKRHPLRGSRGGLEKKILEQNSEFLEQEERK